MAAAALRSRLEIGAVGAAARWTGRPARRALILALALGAGLAPAARAAELTLSAASSLADAFAVLLPMFEAAHPGTTVRLNTAASGVLLQQALRGAPVDVLATADSATMDRAQTLLRAGSRQDFASNALVVVVPAADMAAAAPARATLAALADLVQPQVTRVAVGVPDSVPAGRYARQALESAGLWAALAPKVVGAQNVRQALDYAARGEVDAAFVYATDAALMPARVRVAFQVPGVAVRYPIAVLARSADPVAAQRLIDFLGSAPAQAVLARHGFGAP